MFHSHDYRPGNETLYHPLQATSIVNSGLYHEVSLGRSAVFIADERGQYCATHDAGTIHFWSLIGDRGRVSVVRTLAFLDPILYAAAVRSLTH